MDQLLVVLFFTGVAVLWWHLRSIKELALMAAKAHCEQMGVQFLDEVVTLKNIWLKKNARGETKFWVSYDFEFSTVGATRYNGQLVMLGGAVQRISLEPHPDTEIDQDA